MKPRNSSRYRPVAVLAILSAFALIAPDRISAQLTDGRGGEAQLVAQVGPGATLVHSQFGGQIFGFDIDQNGSEGVLSEAQALNNGKVLAAVETFDQASGKILKVITKLETGDDFLTLGVVGSSVGLVEHEHVKGIYVNKRIYDVLNPLDSNKFSGTWTPPLASDNIIISVSRNQYPSNHGAASNAVMAFENGGNFNTFVFGADVAANTAQPFVTLTDEVFDFGDSPVMAYDNQTNQAVVAASTGEVGGPPPVIALVDLTSGTVIEFDGLPGAPPYRAGFVNGIAVDSDDGIACTTTELDFSVEFYNLKKQTGFAVTLPGASNQIQSGSDVEFDPVNKLFLVAQSVSSTGQGSSIQVYDTKGNLVESLNGFSFSNAFNVVFTHIALNPTHRSGYVDGPDSGVTEIQSFTY
ncbi:MAG: hypothetical protein ABSD75_20240 [Terriglobales bacterium]|jgi:hypothetical protein